MIDDELIQWDEGLFVRPQHFQVMQRQSVRRHAVERRLSTPFPYGVVSGEPAVTGSRVAFEQLQVVLRDGTVVWQGHNATVRPVDLAGDDRFTLHLAVRRDGAAYRSMPHPAVADEVTGGDAVPVVGRLIDAHLVAGETPDPVVWESLPVLRVTGGQVDEAFAPPCYRLSASRVLRRLVADVFQRVRTARDAAATAVASGSDTVGRGDLWLAGRHQALCYFAAVLSHQLRDDSLSPYAAYGTCLELLATVATGAAVESAYDHDDPYPAFAKLHAELASATTQPADPPRQYDLKPLDPPMPPDLQGCHPDLEALLSGRHTAVLAVAADRPEDVEAMQQLLTLRNLRIAAPGALVAFQAGLLLAWQTDEGADFPPIHAGLGATRFIRLTVQPGTPGWQRVKAERTLAVRYPTMAAGRRELRLRFRLYVASDRA